MASTIRTPLEVLQRSVQAMETCRTRVEAQRRRVEIEVTSTLAGNWHGEAASAFQAAMNPWYELSTTITQALARMRDLMEVTQRELAAGEDQAINDANLVGRDPAMQL